MNETYISFYLRVNRIHLFIDSLRKIGSPSRICFMLGEDGMSLLVAPYTKRDFKSHFVPPEVYAGSDSLEINSYKFCRILARIHGWDPKHSYRVPGRVYPEQSMVIFDLQGAQRIGL